MKAPSQFTSDTTHPTSLLTPVQQSRLTFFTNLIEQVMKHLDDKVLEDRILPVIYPILKWKKDFNKDLYESAHAAVLSVFAAQKPVSRELAGVYAKIMLEVTLVVCVYTCSIVYKLFLSLSPDRVILEQ